jgi:hypothetical protein
LEIRRISFHLSRLALEIGKASLLRLSRLLPAEDLVDFAVAQPTADLDKFGDNGRPIQGVFTGPSPVRDKVLQAGDTCEGVRVTSVFTCADWTQPAQPAAALVVQK